MNNFTPEEVAAAKAVRAEITQADADEFVQCDMSKLKSVYMAGEICMWDELRNQSELDKHKESIDILLSKVDDGKHKFATDPYFRSCVECMVRGQHPIVLIDIMCQKNNQMHDRMQDILQSHMQKLPIG